MMIETDILYVYVKTEDWLKPIAETLIRKIEMGDFGEMCASREVLHELYYVFMKRGASLDEFINRVTAMTAMDNLVFLETGYTIDLLAFLLS